MVGATGRGSAARGQRRRRPAVRAQPPAGTGGLVDRPAHQRVAEREAPRHVRRAHEALLEEHVQRVEPGARVELGDLRRVLGVERVAGHRGGLEKQPDLRVEPAELVAQGGGDGLGDAVGPGRRRALVRAGPARASCSM